MITAETMVQQEHSVEDRVPFTVLYQGKENYLLFRLRFADTYDHTAENNYCCGEATCICMELEAQLIRQREDGLLTDREFDLILEGRTI